MLLADFYEIDVVRKFCDLFITKEFISGKLATVGNMLTLGKALLLADKYKLTCTMVSIVNCEFIFVYIRLLLLACKTFQSLLLLLRS